MSSMVEMGCSLMLGIGEAPFFFYGYIISLGSAIDAFARIL